MPDVHDIIDIVWPLAELLRHDYKRSDYGKVVLPFTVLRRLDCVLKDTKDKVLDAAAKLPDTTTDKARELVLNRVSGRAFHNRSPYNFRKLMDEEAQIEANLQHFINGFSANIREILEYFAFGDQIVKLKNAGLLYRIVKAFAAIDLHPDKVSNEKMGTVFEELIRRFAEQSNETAGEHFTPREVVRLMVNLVFVEDRDLLTKQGIVRTVYDPACGTGGMLTIAEEYLKRLNPDGSLVLFGQEINPESYAVCKADITIKGHKAENIKFGNSFSNDGLSGERFDYMLSNPPFGVEWRKVEKEIREEHEKQGFAGRFGPGLPRISDGSLLFLLHMLAKRKEDENGTRIGIVFNGSPLFSGGAGSGESEIRRWIIENDWLEAVVGLPTQLFYNTGITTYIWIVTNRKPTHRRGKVQLVNAEKFFVKMPRSKGDKRQMVGDGDEGRPNHIAEICRIFGDFKPGPDCKIFDNADFGYRRITVERPLRLNFSRAPERIRRLLELKTVSADLRLRAWNALTHDGTKNPDFDETESIATLTNPKASAMDRESAWEELTHHWVPSPVSETAYHSKTEFRDRVMMPLYKSASRTPPASKPMQAILEILGERDETADSFTEADDATPVADPQLRDFENVPLKEDVNAFFAREVLPHVPDAWINTSVTDDKDNQIGKVGYEIPFTRHFYVYKQPESVAALEAQIFQLEAQIQGMLTGVLK